MEHDGAAGQPVGQLAHGGAGPRDVGEPERGEPLLGRFEGK